MNVIQHISAKVSVIVCDVQKVFLAFSAYNAYTGSVKGMKSPRKEIVKMKNLETYARECLAELNAIDIYPNAISEWKVSRAVSRWGMCSYKTRSHVYSISISKVLLADNAPVKGLKETIIHELLHAVDGCLDHGYKWTALVNKVNRSYGYAIQQSDDFEHKGFDTNPMDALYKYHITCESCGRVYRYGRMCSTVKAVEQRKARCCCGSKNLKVLVRP